MLSLETRLLQRIARQTRTRMRIERLHLALALRAFDPAQPRKPAGQSDGGEWAKVDGPQLAQSRPRSPLATATPAQLARLAVSRSQADAAIRRVREIDPGWRPPPSLTAPGSVEGEIARNEAAVREAGAALRRLAARPIDEVLSPGGVPFGSELRGSRQDTEGDRIRRSTSSRPRSASGRNQCEPMSTPPTEASRSGRGSMGRASAYERAIRTVARSTYSEPRHFNLR